MIKIINGVFGFNNGISIVPKTSKDEPFEAPADVEKRLVEIGVAEYVGKTEATEPTEEVTEEAEAVDLQTLKLAELKEYAKEQGATDEELKPLNSKAKVIELIEKLTSEEEEVPDLNSDDGVVE